MCVSMRVCECVCGLTSSAMCQVSSSLNPGTVRSLNKRAKLRALQTQSNACVYTCTLYEAMNSIYRK